MILSTNRAIGWKGQDFALGGTDGKTYSLADVRGPKGTLVVFTWRVAPHAWQNVAASFGWIPCQWPLRNRNRYLSKVRSARHVGERILHLIKRKGPVDHRLHAVGRDRIHHRLKIFN
jgi:hypothetical protein